MLRNYLKVSLRNLNRYRFFSIINILGFALGLFVCFIIALYVIFDLSFDRYHSKGEQIYRVVSFDNTRNWISAVTSGPLLLRLGEEIPEISGSTRLTFGFSRLQPGEIPAGSDSLAIFRQALFTGPGFFDVFDFEIVSGNSETPLVNLQGVYLTEEAAGLLFGDEDPVGRPLNTNFINDAFVAGIITGPPVNSHLQFGAIFPLNVERNPIWWDSWENLALTGYIRLREGADPEVVGEKLVELARRYGMSEVFTPRLQPLLKMHMDSQGIRYDAINQQKTSREVVYGLMVIGLLVLLVASINFINLTSARSSKRAREIGMRKIVGAVRKQIIIQFLFESVLQTLLAMLLALAVAEITLPALRGFLQRDLSVNLFESPEIIFWGLFSAVLVGILAGIYPALVISGFQPVKVLKGKFQNSSSGIGLRRILVTGQFTVSIALIIGVLIVREQVRYLQRIDFGYDRERVSVIPAFDNTVDYGNDNLRSRFGQLPFVQLAGRTDRLPGATLPTTEVCFGSRQAEPGGMFDELVIDDCFLSVLNIRVIQGRGFSPASPADSGAVLINATAYRMSGWQDIEGRSVIIRGADEQDVRWDVIGVIEDINFGMAQRVIEPMVIRYNPVQAGFLLLRTAQSLSQEQHEQLEQVYLEVFLEGQFRIFPFDDIFARQFQTENDFAGKVTAFTILAIFIACLGLYGLAAFTTEQRRQEIAVRKVLGSSIRRIVILLNSEFGRLVLLSNLIAWPLSYLVMKEWLQGFAYRTPINSGPFLIAGLTALVISILTVSIQTIRVALSDPIKSLQYE